MAAMSPKPYRITVSLGAREYSLLCAIAEERDVSLSWAARRAIAEYVERSAAPQQGELPLARGVQQGLVEDDETDDDGR